MCFWKNKKVLVTGHTGFKGSWLCLWLQYLGAEVIGYALNPPTPYNLFSVAKVEDNMISIIGDIRNKRNLIDLVREYKPEVIFHLAAQPIVRKSYEDPVDTFETNVIGLVYLLEAVRNSNNVKVVVNITSDKCYENKEWIWGYRETDAVGGYDPYSCSKGCSELITNSYRKSFLNDKNIFIASARAGNVIGGGDWAQDRLVPDIIKSLMDNKNIVIRNPYAVRPWQHVLEPLSGYMMLAERMWKDGEKFSQAWNFGPNDESIITVGELTNRFIELWGSNLEVVCDKREQHHEAQILKLDCSKAKSKLGWYPKLTIENTLKWTSDWYKGYIEGNDMKKLTLKQILEYEQVRSEC